MRSYMNTPQVAKLLGVNIQTVREYIRSGELPAARIGRRYVISRDDIDLFIAKRKEARKTGDLGLTEKGREAARKLEQNSERVLAYLDDYPGAKSDEISEALGLDPQETRRALRFLQGRGLAHSEVDEDEPDRRNGPWYRGGERR